MYQALKSSLEAICFIGQRAEGTGVEDPQTFRLRLLLIGYRADYVTQTVER